MNQKKAKMLRRVSRRVCNDTGKPLEVSSQYKKLKKTYKLLKGQK